MSLTSSLDGVVAVKPQPKKAQKKVGGKKLEYGNSQEVYCKRVVWRKRVVDGGGMFNEVKDFLFLRREQLRSVCMLMLQQRGRNGRGERGGEVRALSSAWDVVHAYQLPQKGAWTVLRGNGREARLPGPRCRQVESC